MHLTKDPVIAVIHTGDGSDLLPGDIDDLKIFNSTISSRTNIDFRLVTIAPRQIDGALILIIMLPHDRGDIKGAAMIPVERLFNEINRSINNARSFPDVVDKLYNGENESESAKFDLTTQYIHVDGAKHSDDFERAVLFIFRAPIVPALSLRVIESAIFASLGYNQSFSELNNSIFSRSYVHEDITGVDIPKYMGPTDLDFEILRILYSVHEKRLIGYDDVVKSVESIP